MAYDERMADRIRRLLAREDDLREQRMMGGLIFMVNGSMCCGVHDHGLIVRVGADNHAAACTEPHVRPMDVGGGRQPKGFVHVAPEGFASDAALKAWVARGLAFVRTLPAKKAVKPRKTAKAK